MLVETTNNTIKQECIAKLSNRRYRNINPSQLVKSLLDKTSLPFQPVQNSQVLDHRYFVHRT